MSFLKWNINRPDSVMCTVPMRLETGALETGALETGALETGALETGAFKTAAIEIVLEQNSRQWKMIVARESMLTVRSENYIVIMIEDLQNVGADDSDR